MKNVSIFRRFLFYNYYWINEFDIWMLLTIIGKYTADSMEVVYKLLEFFYQINQTQPL